MNSNENGASKQQIKQIISKSYSKSWSKLSLQNQVSTWRQILCFQKWSQLKQIHLPSCRITDMDMYILINFSWPGLQKINLSSNQITANGVRKIAKVQWEQLTKIHLSQNAIGSQGFVELYEKKQAFYRHIQELVISNTNLLSIALKNSKLLTSFMKNIKFLTLSENKIGSKGIKLLVKNNFNVLEQLWLENCEMGANGAKHLSKAKWQKITSLFIDKNYVGLDGYFCFHCHSLQTINQVRVEKDEFIKIIGFAAIKLSKRGKYRCFISSQQFQKYIKNCFPPQKIIT